MKTCVTCKYHSAKNPNSDAFDDVLIWHFCTLRMHAVSTTDLVTGKITVRHEGLEYCHDERRDEWKWTPLCGPSGLHWEEKK